MKPKFHSACFACGLDQPMGLRLHFDTGEDGLARALWNPSPAFRSYEDRIHGGVIATLLDSAMVHALFARNIEGVTADTRIRYRKKVGLDQPVRLSGWVESQRLGVYLCRAELHQENDLAVSAQAKFMKMP